MDQHTVSPAREESRATKRYVPHDRTWYQKGVVWCVSTGQRVYRERDREREKVKVRGGAQYSARDVPS
eukprot:197497-Rhodomonas_salina.4